MKAFRKGKQLQGFRIVSVLSRCPGRIEYSVVPVERDDQIEYHAIVYDLDELPVEYLWASSDWSSEPVTALESRFLEKCSLPVFPVRVAEGEAGGLPWVVVKLNDGLTISEYISIYGMLSPAKAIRAVVRLCESVEAIAAFEGGMGHYNITPETVRIWAEPEIPVLSLEGFGYMTREMEGVKFIRPIEQSCYYLAPEQFLGNLSGKADVYGICMILYMLLTGKAYPWDRDSQTPYIEVLQKKCGLDDFMIGMGRVWNSAPDLAQVQHRRLRAVLLKGLSTNPTHRTASVVELQEQLEQVLALMGEMQVAANGVNEKLTGGFSAVAGLSELKEQMRRKFILPIRQRKLAKAYKITPPNGCLLFGPPGCGKTFVASRIAEEAGIPCVIYKPSDIASIYVHGGQEKIKELFDDARRHAPVMICFDEADSFVSGRSNPGNEQYAGEVNEFLTQLNNAAKDGLYVFLLTNNPELLDPAVLRTGRVDEKFYIPIPDAAGREEFFRIRFKDIPATGEMDYETLAALSGGMTFSDLDYIVTESCRMVFLSAIEQDTTRILPVSQEVVEAVIASTPRSVSYEEVRRYEKMRDELISRGSGKQRAKMGFT